MLRRNRNENVEDIKYEIEEWKAKNKKMVEINLFPGEEEYLIKNDYIVRPILFIIKDRNLKNMKDCPNFIKSKHYKKAKKVFRLKKREKDLLDSHGIKYEPIGFVVYL